MRQADTIGGADASIAFTTTSSILCIKKEVSVPCVRKCRSNALRVHLWPTSSASGSSLL